MKLLTALLFFTLFNLTSNTSDMIEKLKTHIQNKESEKAISFIKQNPEVLSLEDNNGTSGLMIIAYSGLKKVLEKAIELKKSFSFHESIVTGKMKIIKSYLEKSPTNLINPSKVNGLHSAIAKENYELCKILLAKGADVNAVQMQNVTALHSAVHRGNLKLTKLLIQNGASIDLKMDNGDTALIIAEREGYKNIVEYLLGK